MLRYFLTATLLFASAAFMHAAQTPSAPGQAAAKSADAKEQPADKNSPKLTKKAKKVWTGDDLSKLSGSISVVGDASTASASKSASKVSGAKSDNSAQNREIQNYREQLRQLQAQLDATDKKIEDLRNFKGENTSATGGINPHGRYTMTPISEQIKQLEENKKQVQDKIDAVTDEARKKGIEPGQLR